MSPTTLHGAPDAIDRNEEFIKLTLAVIMTPDEWSIGRILYNSIVDWLNFVQPCNYHEAIARTLSI